MKNCQLPKYPQHGIYTLLKRSGKYEPGSSVPPHNRLTLICNSGYNIASGASKFYNCSQNGLWTPPLAGCTLKKDPPSDVNYTNIGLIAAFSILFIIALVAGLLYKYKFKKTRELRRELKLSGQYKFQKGNLKQFNPELGIDDQAELLPYNINYEFPREKLKLCKQLGSGEFGIVIKAQAFGIVSKEEKTTVAVKTVKSNTDNSQMKTLIAELKIMVHLGQHLNVVNLLGACTQNITKRELFVIVEYCPFGNLYNYLLQNRKNYVDQIDEATGNIDYNFGCENLENVLVVVPNNASKPRKIEDHNKSTKSLFTKDIISWAFQVANGMEYLASRKIVHGDLAARNVLLAENNIVKICDFGLAKRMYKTTNYKSQEDCLLPIKWMATESIRHRDFSSQSDIWSYGIVLWEMFSLAQTPHPGIETEERLYHKLMAGYQMESPQYAPKDIYKVMCDCWNVNPLLRPEFNKLAGTVGLMLEENVRQHYIDLNDPYFVMNTQRLNKGENDYLVTLSAPDYKQAAAFQDCKSKDVIKDSGNLGVIPSYLTVIDKAEVVSNHGDAILVQNE